MNTVMQSKSTRIAYLKRMLKRLEGEHKRIQDLVLSGKLAPEAALIGAEMINKSRDELLAELEALRATM